MYKQLAKINARDGVDARGIALLVQEVGQYTCRVYLEIGEKNINAKSIMGMMSLSLNYGQEINVAADGDNEEEAAKKIAAFIDGMR